MPAARAWQSLGDGDCGEWLLADPDVYSCTLPAEHGVDLLLASDGLWDVLEADEVKGLALRFFVAHCAEAMACYARPDERLGWWSAAQECALLEEIARALVGRIADAPRD